MIVEARRYTVYPGKLPAYLQMFVDNRVVLDELNKNLCGFWFNESGPLNTVHHLWHYKDRVARATRRTQLAVDPDMQKFIAKVSPFLQSQESTIYRGDIASSSVQQKGGVFSRFFIEYQYGVSELVKKKFSSEIAAVLKNKSSLVCALSSSNFDSANDVQKGLFIARHSDLAEQMHCMQGISEDICEMFGSGIVKNSDYSLMLPAPFSKFQ